jgi:hypothetical protein
MDNDTMAISLILGIALLFLGIVVEHLIAGLGLFWGMTVSAITFGLLVLIAAWWNKIKASLPRFAASLDSYASDARTWLIMLAALWLYCAGMSLIVAWQRPHAETTSNPVPSSGQTADESVYAPHLSGHINRLFVGHFPDTPEYRAEGAKYGFLVTDGIVTLVATVRNTGSPSIAENWELILETPHGSRETAMPEVLSPNMTLPVSDEKQTTMLGGWDALYAKTAEQPIPTGGLRRGVLVFHFHHVEAATVQMPDNKVYLQFTDQLGHVITSEPMTMHLASTMDASFLPGLTMPLVMPTPVPTPHPHQQRPRHPHD